MSGDPVGRRLFIRQCARCASAWTLAAAAGTLIGRSSLSAGLYQIDAKLCEECGRCATHCVRTPSAVKCVNNFEKCGYCTYCYGYQIDNNPGQEIRKVCPRDAIVRRQVGEVQYEYTIDESKCDGCGKCVQRCRMYGNGTLSLVIRRDLCKECNRCSIAAACPPGAIIRRPYTDAKAGA